MLSPRGQRTVLKMRDAGYVSHYAFSQEDAALIKERGHSRGFDEFAVWANCLIIDIDTGREADLRQALSKLQGIRLDVYSSGSKGFHIQVWHRWMQSEHLPHSHLMWVEAQGLGIPYDRTMFQHGRIVSLPGRIHPKTKRRKTLLFRQRGRLIDVPIIAPPQPTFNFEGQGDLDKLQSALLRVANVASIDPAPGDRHRHLWGTAEDLARAGISYETALELLLNINDRWSNPKSPDEVRASVSSAYKRRNG